MTAKPPGRRAVKVARRRRNIAANSLAVHRKSLVKLGVNLEESPHADPVETHELLINKVTELWRVAEAECDLLKPGLAPRNRNTNQMLWELNWALDAEGNIIISENEWLKIAARLRKELAELTATSAKLGLDERVVRIREEQTRIIGEAVLAAALDAGIKPAQQRRLGSALREKLADIESTATVIS